MAEFRDPRFDPRCNGTNNFKNYVKNYAFLDQVRKEEIGELEKALRKERNVEKRNMIKSTITRLKNKMVERKNRSQKDQLINELKASSGGRKYRNVKKSDIKKNLIVRKFKELKESGKLSKYMERKRKKLINRDGKAFEQIWS